LLAAQGKVEEAIAEYLAAAELQPELAEARSDLGNLLSAQRKWQEAVEAYREAIEIKPDEAPFHYELGLILMKQGKRAEAIAAFREAHAMPDPAPTSPGLSSGHCPSPAISPGPLHRRAAISKSSRPTPGLRRPLTPSG
jgi:tetratricopeptide (TPR) repeat protein